MDLEVVYSSSAYEVRVNKHELRNAIKSKSEIVLHFMDNDKLIAKQPVSKDESTEYTDWMATCDFNFVTLQFVRYIGKDSFIVIVEQVYKYPTVVSTGSTIKVSNNYFNLERIPASYVI